MAKLYATSPNGTAKSIQLETMNIIGEDLGNAFTWFKFPNGLIIQTMNNGFEQQNDDHDYKTYPITFPTDIIVIIASGYTNEKYSDVRYNYYTSALYHTDTKKSKVSVTGFRVSKVLEKIDQYNYTVWGMIFAIGC